MADPRLLRQIATNLISNAIKYSPKASEVRVSLERQDEQTILTVRDQGVGIPKPTSHACLTPFSAPPTSVMCVGQG